MKIMTIVGARPQFVKAAPVSKAIRQKHEEILIHTGQHYDDEMSDVFFRTMGIPEADYNLGVGSGSHGWQTAQMLERIEDLIIQEKPDWLLVYGDTNSTVAGALAAAKMHIPIAHVEAGLRSYDMRMPEEVNRRMTDHVSRLLFCPTKTSIDNLEKEGITEGVHLVGDVMLDSAKMFGDLPTDVLERVGVKSENYYFMTVHRPVNTDNEDNLKNILNTVSESVRGIDPDMKVIFPAHPRTVAFIEQYEMKMPDNIKVIKPVNYIESLCLIKNAKKVLTDSGGMQKEAYFMGTTCITLRERTEWVETVQDGWNILVAADPVKIKDAIINFEPSGERGSSYGDGHASEKIVEIIENTTV